MQSIDYVAWWGALVATMLLLWDIAKWIKTGPIIRERIKVDTSYPDGKVLGVEKTENGEARELATYCHIELVNTGTLPTTIMGICASHIDNQNLGQMEVTNQRFLPHYEKFLPYILTPGEVWSCRLEMSDIHRLAERGKSYIEVTLSHRRKPIVIRPRLAANKPLQTDAAVPRG